MVDHGYVNESLTAKLQTEITRQEPQAKAKIAPINTGKEAAKAVVQLLALTGRSPRGSLSTRGSSSGNREERPRPSHVAALATDDRVHGAQLPLPREALVRRLARRSRPAEDRHRWGQAQVRSS